MVARLVHVYTILLILLLIAALNASRLFYLPLTKLHASSSDAENQPSPLIVQKSTEDIDAGKPIPASVMELPLNGGEEDKPRRRYALDWDTLVDEETAALRRLMDARERSSGNHRDYDFLDSLDRHTRKPAKKKISQQETEAAIDRLTQFDKKQAAHQPWVVDTATERAERLQSDTAVDSSDRKKRRNDTLFLMIVGTCTVVGVLGLVAAAVFWFKIQRQAESAVDSEYPAYGNTGPGSSKHKISPSSTMSDRKLAQSAQMFHYQQQRQQMIAQDKDHFDIKPAHSDDSDDEAAAGGDYTVYECPGLAPTGEMEVRNPLFAEPDSPFNSSGSSAHPATNSHYPQLSNSKGSLSSSPKEKFLS